jgi:hypothetical protein
VEHPTKTAQAASHRRGSSRYPYNVSANVVFLGGADFDPPPLGITDRTRYVKVTSLEKVHRPELQKWI